MAKTTEATKERRPVLIEYMDKDAPEVEPSDEELAFEAFQNEFAESDSYAKITVYRQPTGPGNRPGQKKLAFLFECGIDEFTFSQLLSKLRDEYGSGTYRLQARDSNSQLKFNRAVEIEATRKEPASGQESTSEIMRAVNELITASQARLEETIAKFREPVKPTVDPMTTMAQTMAMFTQMLGAMAPILGGGAKAAGGDFMGELQKFAAIKSLLGDLAGGGGDGGAAETNFYDTINQTLRTVAPALAGVLATRGGAVPALPATVTPQSMNPNPATVPEAAGAPPQPTQVANVNLQRQVAILVAQAKGGATPEDVADMVLDMTPEDKLVELHTFISRPTVVNEMAAVNPAVAEHRAFFDRLRACILEQLTDRPEDTPTPPAPASHPPTTG